MRDPERIPRILSLIAEGWKKVPDWRAGQLIENLKRYSGKEDLFYIEDDELARLIIEYFKLNEASNVTSSVEASQYNFEVGM